MRYFYVYILRCADGSYYVGHTDDIDVRMQQHAVGDTGYTATRKPVELLWQGELETREGAIAFEQQIKGWSRAKKEALMAGDWRRVQALAQSKTGVACADRLRQAQPERLGVDAQLKRLEVHAQPEPPREDNPVHPERVEGPAHQRGECISTTTTARPEQNLVRPEPVEGPAHKENLAEQGQKIPITPAGDSLLERILHGNATIQRRAMAKAITLLESTRADHRTQGDELLTQILPHTGGALRLGISGVPGVGKSTFIETLGLHLIGQGHRVAVLAIDPSSTVSGGSILGDKTRMEHLSMREEAYIRPSPSSGTLGGVAEKTREAMLVCEAAGYDIVIVETVGVGQSETTVWGMTDMFVLLQLPNAGDELQAIKKGVMEIADLVVINKADLDANAARRAQAQITSSLRLLGLHGSAGNERHDASFWQPKVLQISALVRTGIDDFWAAVTEFNTLQAANGRREQRRQRQNLAWMWQRIDAGLKDAFRQNPQVQALLPQMLAEVADGRIAASTAARNMLSAHTG